MAVEGQAVEGHPLGSARQQAVGSVTLALRLELISYRQSYALLLCALRPSEQHLKVREYFIESSDLFLGQSSTRVEGAVLRSEAHALMASYHDISSMARKLPLQHRSSTLQQELPPPGRIRGYLLMQALA
jgi:hypothetical protein